MQHTPQTPQWHLVPHSTEEAHGSTRSTADRIRATRRARGHVSGKGCTQPRKHAPASHCVPVGDVLSVCSTPHRDSAGSRVAEARPWGAGTGTSARYTHRKKREYQGTSAQRTGGWQPTFKRNENGDNTVGGHSACTKQRQREARTSGKEKRGVGAQCTSTYVHAGEGESVGERTVAHTNTR